MFRISLIWLVLSMMLSVPVQAADIELYPVKSDKGRWVVAATVVNLEKKGTGALDGIQFGLEGDWVGAFVECTKGAICARKGEKIAVAYLLRGQRYNEGDVLFEMVFAVDDRMKGVKFGLVPAGRAQVLSEDQTLDVNISVIR